MKSGKGPQVIFSELVLFQNEIYTLENGENNLQVWSKKEAFNSVDFCRRGGKKRRINHTKWVKQ